MPARDQYPARDFLSTRQVISHVQLFPLIQSQNKLRSFACAYAFASFNSNLKPATFNLQPFKTVP
jgi:hypothetical protein